MSYKLGYFYNLPFCEGWSGHNNRLLLTFDNGHLKFVLIDPSLVKGLTFSNMSYYSFDYPVLYSEDTNGNVCNIEFLKDFPIRFRSELLEIDKELYIPFIVQPNTSNPCNKLRTTTGSLLGYTQPYPTIYINGKDFISIDKTEYYRIKRGEASKDKETLPNLFYRAAITYHTLSNLVYRIKLDTFRLGLYTLPVEPDNNDFYVQSIHLAKGYIDSINMDEILSDLKITVTEHFRHKRDDDDTYSVYRHASVGSTVAQNDLYLSRLIGLGENRIYQDSGYCSAESMRIKGLITGEYSGENLQGEKDKIIAKYSKEEHMGAILSETYSRLMHTQNDLASLEALLREYQTILAESFNMAKISNVNRRFEQNFYDLHSRYNKTPQKTVDDINNKIREITRCNLSVNDIEKLGGEGLKIPTSSYPKSSEII